jgi:hypothetical protein
MPPRILRNLCLGLTTLLLSPAATRSLRAQDTAAAELYSARGTVVNSLTGQGIPRALVTLNDQYAVLTGGDGEFSIDNLPSGSYFASVSKPGYLGFGSSRNGMAIGVRNGVHIPGTPPRQIHVGPDMPNLTFRVAPTAAIVGQISLSTADPADGIHITLFRRQMHFGHPVWEMAGTARSRSDGSFRVGGLPAGSYLVCTQASLDAPDVSEASRLPVWGYPPAYYPGVTDPGAAGVITLGPGQQVEADVSLTRQQFFPVTAVVRAADMQMPGDFEVLDMGGHPTGLSAQYDNRRGVVRANVPNGSWVLVGRGFGRDMTWGRTEFQVAGAPAGLAVNMQTVPHIPLNIQRELTSTTSATYSGPGLNLVLASAEPFAIRNVSGGIGPVSGSNGSAWQINLVEPGRFFVEASPYGGEYVSSVTSGGVDLAGAPLVVVPGSQPPSIDITLRDDGGSISGQLNSGAPQTGPTAEPNAQVVVYAIPQFPFAGQLPQTAVQADGTFTFSNLAPGAWRVVACDSPQEIDYHSPEGLSAWTGKGQTVTVDAGGSVHVTLDGLAAVESAP